MIPSVSIKKVDGQTGVVRPGVEGILAIIAPSQKGTVNQPASYARADLAYTDFGDGPLVEFGAYVMSVAGNPVLIVRGNASTAGAYSSITTTGGGTSVVTADASAPYDDYEVVVTIVTGGTIGVAGITYTYSLDGGVTTSGVQALGTASTLAIPNSNVGLDFAAGTVLAGQTETFTTTAPQMNNSDIAAALEALRTSNLPWEMVLVHGIATSTTIGTVDTWLLGRESEGRFKGGFMNGRFKNSGESEASFATAMNTAFGTTSTIRVSVGADGGHLASARTGLSIRRPTSLGLAARCMSIDISRDAAFVSDGALNGYQIADNRGNPLHHDEALFPGLDDLRLATLRSFNGQAGTYINNPLLLSPFGSDYVYVQHLRVINKASDIAYQILTNRLSQGVRKDPRTGFILEQDAQEIENLVNSAFDGQLKKLSRVSEAKFVLSRVDDLSSNGGATLNCEVLINAIAYVKKFSAQAKFVKAIAAKV